MRVYKKLKVSGPTKMPTGPRSDIPPNTEKRMRNGEMWIFVPITRGLKKLSTMPTINTDQRMSPIAGIGFPVKKRKMIPGIETIAVPKVGMSDVTAATTPQRAPCGTPKNEKPRATKIP